MRIVIGIICLVASLLCLANCGGSKSTTAVDDSIQTVSPAASLPNPTDVARSASGANPRFASGVDYLPGYTQNVVDNGTAAQLTATWGPGQMTAADTAYAIYSFDLSSYGGLERVKVSWDTLPGQDLAYLGLADFSRDRWVWHLLSTSAPLDYDPDTNVSGAGQLLVAIVSLDTDMHQVNFVRVGEDMEPQISFSADYYSGSVPLDVGLSALGSTDVDGVITKYEFDPLGNDSWVDNDTNPEFNYNYTSPGVYFAAVRITDNAGNTASEHVRIGAGWQHSWGGVGYDDGNCVEVDPTGNVIVLGLTTNFGQGANEILLLKYSPGGNLLWQKTFGTTNGDQPMALEIDPTGNIYVGLSSLAPVTLDYKPVVFSLAPAGTLRWQKYWDMPSDTELAGLALGGADSLYLTMIHFQLTPTESQIMYAKVSATDGSQQWAYDWGGDGTERPLALAADESGNGYVALRSDSFSGDSSNSCVVMSFSPDGSVTGSYAYGMGSVEEPTSISVANGSVYLTTEYGIACISTTGGLIWQNQLAFSGMFYVVSGRARNDGCYLAGAFTNPSFADGFLLDFSNTGILVAAKALSSAAQNNAVYGQAIAPSGGVYLTGRAPNASAQWLDCMPSYSNPGHTTTSVSAPRTSSGVSNLDFTGVLADVTPGTPTEDTGGGSDDVISGYYFPW